MTGQGRFLVLSPDGMLGRAWTRRLAAAGIEHDGIVYPDLDLTRPATLDAVAWDRYTTVINCAAFTDVDGAEEREDEATAVNGEGVGRLAERCRDAGATLVHYSTDYVFDGQGTAPYPVDHPRAPLNAYGRSKAVGEEGIEASGTAFLLVRTSWLYAAWGNNFVLTMAKLGRERDALRVVDDQRGRPTSATHLADASLRLLQASVRGVVHVCDGGECTWFGFASEVVSRVNPQCRVSPCTTAEFPRPAVRPPYSVLDMSITEAAIGSMPPWQDNVAAVLAEAAAPTSDD